MKLEFSQEDLRAVGALISHMVSLTRALIIYGPDHPRTDEQRDLFMQEYKAAAKGSTGIGGRLLILWRERRLYLENVPLPQQGVHVESFFVHLERYKISGIALELRLSEIECTEIVTALSNREPKQQSLPKGLCWVATSELAQLDSSLERRVDSSAGHSGNMRQNAVFKIPELMVDEGRYLQSVEQLAQFMANQRSSDEADTSPVTEALDLLVDQMVSSTNSVMPLTTVPYFDSYTYYHSVNVCLISLKAAHMVISDTRYLRRIAQAALFHDIGKARIPEEVLYKPGRLTDAERVLVEEHPTLGTHLLQRFPDADPMVIAAAFGHHIKDRNSGYPRVSESYRRGPVTALIQVADIFEALTAHRPYKRSLSSVQAFEIMYGMENIKELRPVLDLLYHSVGLQPAGTRIETADGEKGVVCQHKNGDPRLPIARIVQTSKNGEVVSGRLVEGVTAGARREGEEEIEFVSIDPEMAI